MSQRNSSKSLVSLPESHHQCSSCFSEVGIQPLILNCLSLHHSGHFIFSLIFPQPEWWEAIDFFLCRKRIKIDLYFPTLKKQNPRWIKGWHRKGKALGILDANVEMIFMNLEEFLHQNTKIENYKRLKNLTTLWTSLSLSNIIILLTIIFGEINVF